MKQRGLVLTLLILLAAGGQASAELCAIDAVPAATLLLPYFEVDLLTPPLKGVDTLFSIHNASASPTLAHVSVWTDWAQPVLDFDLFLTGYDVQAVSLREVLVKGRLPVTADQQSDQGQDGGRIADETSTCDGTADSCSPHGADPDWDASFDGTGVLADGVADCLDIFPFFVNPLLEGTRLDEVQAKLSGQPIDGACFGADHGGDPNLKARGYVTIDNVNACSLIFPNDPGYFSDGVAPGLASNANQLWGDWFLIDPVAKYAAGDSLVHVEAADGFTGDANDYTFYRRFGVITASEDNREPLGTTWGVRYLNGAPFSGTELVVWRDATITDIRDGGFACGAPGSVLTGPSWHPLNETQVVAFNETESWEQVCGLEFGPPGPPVSPPTDPSETDPVCFPLVTQSVPTGVEPLDLTSEFGWLYLNLNIGIDDPRAGEPGVDYDPSGVETLAQSYVQANHRAMALYAVGYPAAELTSACQADDVSLFADP